MPKFSVLWRQEAERWPLWLPVALGAGAGAYFALPFEPPPAWAWIAGAAAAACALIALLGRWRIACALAAALLLGFALAKARAHAVATPVLDRPMTAHLTGRVMEIEPRGAGARLVLDEVRSGAFAAAPRRVRLMQRGGALNPGDWVSLTARLDTPSAPPEPGAGDTGRALYFQSIGAVGFVYGKARPLPAAHPVSLVQAARQHVEALRAGVTRRILGVLPGSQGGVAAALMTGTRGGIAPEDETALRDAGLAHVLAIAGLHMALVGGGLFWLVRAALAAFPSLALRYPIKKWAAVAALAAAGFYLVISGAGVPAVRAFVMFAIAMGAVLLDRPALTMRSLALAGAILLIWQPEGIVEPGFQMSFAAVASLIAVAEWQGRRDPVRRGAVWRHAQAIFMTSLVGSLATLPFALFHFGRAAHYAVLGNLIAMPVMGFWVMPCAALAVMLMPLGWEAPALHLLGAGIAVMVTLARWVSGLPGAVSHVAAMPLSALVAIGLGGLWGALLQTRLRWLGLAPLLLGAVLAVTARGPDMLVGADAMTVALRGRDGRLHFITPPADRFLARAWLVRDGDARDPGDAVGLEGLRCDGVGCVVTRQGLTIAVSRKPEALEEDCARAQLLVSAADAGCKTPALVIGRRAAETGEGWAIRLSPLSAQSVRDWRGARPWVPAKDSE